MQNGRQLSLPPVLISLAGLSYFPVTRIWSKDIVMFAETVLPRYVATNSTATRVNPVAVP